MSQCVEPETSGLICSKNAQVCWTVLYIFQFPAMMGFLIGSKSILVAAKGGMKNS
jgi:hypothetical protein